MFGAGAKHSTPLGHPAYFIPTNSPQVVLASTVKSLYIRYKENLGSEHFRVGGLLLLQLETGTYQWTFLESLSKQDHNVRLYACSLSNKEADFIAKDRVLFIRDDDNRLSNFSLLSRAEKPSRCDEAAESFNLVNRHLASKRPVILYHVDEMGNKITNEIKTADYSRAKLDISLQPENKRNMRRFCNRQGPSGEGPSDLQSRICLGYVKPINYPSNSTSFNSSRQLTINSSNESDTISLKPSPDTNESHFPPIRRYRKHSIAYYLMKIAFYSPARLEVEQHRHDLTYARKEKKPERALIVPEYPRRAQWTTKALKRAFHFCVHRIRCCSSSGEAIEPSIGDIGAPLQIGEEAEYESVSRGEKEIQCCSKTSDIGVEKFSYEASRGPNTDPTLIPSEGIGPFCQTI